MARNTTPTSPAPADAAAAAVDSEQAAAASAVAGAPADDNDGLPPPVVVEDEGEGADEGAEAGAPADEPEADEPEADEPEADTGNADDDGPDFKAAEETGWLIERAGSPPHAPEYLTLKRGRQSWTHDHLEAIRFAREVDARDFAALHLGEQDRDVPRFAEHAWS